MFKKILLPLDLTDRHAAALRLAAELARQSGGEVTLLHVVEVIPGLSREEESPFYARLERKAAAHLERWAGELSSAQVTVRGEVLFGERVREVLDYVSRAAVDLIVLTSPPFEPERPIAGLGSLSYRIGLVCKCPVLLVK
jgi:nucleotide-binding universal stress UspA family protein